MVLPATGDALWEYPRRPLIHIKAVDGEITILKGSSGKGGGGGEIRGISLFLKEYSNFQSTCRHYPLLVFHCESLQPNHDVTLNETASLTQQVNV